MSSLIQGLSQQVNGNSFGKSDPAFNEDANGNSTEIILDAKRKRVDIIYGDGQSGI